MYATGCAALLIGPLAAGCACKRAADPVVAPTPTLPPPSAAPAGAAPAASEPAAAPAATDEGHNVFFSGHSLINLDMPWNVQQIAQANGHAHHYNSQIGIGANMALRLSGGNEQDATGERMTFKVLDEIRSARTLPGGRKYDTLVITEASPIPVTTLSSETVKHTAAFYDALVGGHPAGRVFLYDSWDAHQGDVPGWIDKTRKDHVWYDCIASWVNKQPGRSNPLRLLPAGLMLARAAEAINKGEIPGLKSGDVLFNPDGHHASPLGNYLLAITVYTAIYGSKPELARVTPASRQGVAYAGLPGQPTLAALRDLVWDTLQALERGGHNNRRPMRECRERLVQRCGTVAKFVCENDVQRMFAD
jgi:hypothetical protein